MIHARIRSAVILSYIYDNNNINPVVNLGVVG